MDKNKKEICSFIGGKCQPMIREAAEGDLPSRTIEGYAVVFGVESRILRDMDGLTPYREIIEPGAITEDLLSKQDVKMTMYHNREKLLARSRFGVGSLRLSVDEVGVRYEFEAPNTVDGDTALELVRRGDLYGSSFIFWIGMGDFTREKGKDGIYLHRVKNIRRIDDMTIAADPAYEQTNVMAREAEEQLEDQEVKQTLSVKYAREKREREMIINNFNL